MPSDETSPQDAPSPHESPEERSGRASETDTGAEAPDAEPRPGAPEPKPASETLMTRQQLGAVAVGVVVGLVITVGLAIWFNQPPAQDVVRKTVITTVQEESPASFLVTGTMTLTAEVRIDSTEYVTPEWVTTLIQSANPDLLSFAERTSSAVVRVPGRVSYGFDVSRLSADSITVAEDGFIELSLPRLTVYSVEPDLSKLEVKTETTGWTMLSGVERSEDDVQRQALVGVQKALRVQAQARLNDASQPSVNTARALQQMLRPPLQAAGISNPRIRVRVGNDLTFEEGSG